MHPSCAVSRLWPLVHPQVSIALSCMQRMFVSHDSAMHACAYVGGTQLINGARAVRAALHSFAGCNPLRSDSQVMTFPLVATLLAENNAAFIILWLLAPKADETCQYLMQACTPACLSC